MENVARCQSHSGLLLNICGVTRLCTTVMTHLKGADHSLYSITCYPSSNYHTPLSAQISASCCGLSGTHSAVIQLEASAAPPASN